MNGCAPGLALIERLKATRKWAIHFETMYYHLLKEHGFVKSKLKRHFIHGNLNTMVQ